MFETQADIDTTRQQVAAIQSQVSDFQSQFQQLLNGAQQRFANLQQMHTELTAHLQSEHARALTENQALVQLLGDTDTWVASQTTTLATATKALATELTQTAGDFATTAQSLQASADHTQQGLAKALADLTALEGRAQSEVGQAYQQAGEGLATGVQGAQQDLANLSSAHAQSINTAVGDQFARSQTQFVAQLEQLVAELAQVLDGRSNMLRGEMDQHVRSLQQSQDEQHQELARTVEALRASLADVVALLSSEGSSLTQRVDSATYSMNAMQLSAREAAQNLDAVSQEFQQILSMW